MLGWEHLPQLIELIERSAAGGHALGVGMRGPRSLRGVIRNVFGPTDARGLKQADKIIAAMEKAGLIKRVRADKKNPDREHWVTCEGARAMVNGHSGNAAAAE